MKYITFYFLFKKLIIFFKKNNLFKKNTVNLKKLQKIVCIL